MGVLLRIAPKLRQPVEFPFEVTDKYNGPERGTWWYLDRYQNLFGPFWTQTQAQEHLDASYSTAPHQDNHGFWWWTDQTGGSHGPFTSLRDADANIVAAMNKDTQ